MDLSTKFGKEIPSRNRVKKRSGYLSTFEGTARTDFMRISIIFSFSFLGETWGKYPRAQSPKLRLLLQKRYCSTPLQICIAVCRVSLRPEEQENSQYFLPFVSRCGSHLYRNTSHLHRNAFGKILVVWNGGLRDGGSSKSEDI